MILGNPKSQVFFHLRALGYSPIPLGKDGWSPVKDWTEYCEHQPTDDIIEQWISQYQYSSVGLACGYNGLITVRVHDNILRKHIGQILPPTIFIETSKGVVAFYQSVNVRSLALLKNKHAIIEFCGVGRSESIPENLYHLKMLPELSRDSPEACFSMLGHVFPDDKMTGNPKGKWVKLFADWK